MLTPSPNAASTICVPGKTPGKGPPGGSQEPAARTPPAPPVTDITSTGIPGHRPPPVRRRKIAPTTAQCGGRRRSDSFSPSGPDRRTQVHG